MFSKECLRLSLAIVTNWTLLDVDALAFTIREKDTEALPSRVIGDWAKWGRATRLAKGPSLLETEQGYLSIVFWFFERPLTTLPKVWLEALIIEAPPSLSVMAV